MLLTSKNFSMKSMLMVLLLKITIKTTKTTNVAQIGNKLWFIQTKVIETSKNISKANPSNLKVGSWAQLFLFQL